jgi:hypothetical protein
MRDKTGTRKIGGKIDYDHNRATYELDCVTYLTHRYGFSVFDFFAICKYLTCARKKKWRNGNLKPLKRR